MAQGPGSPSPSFCTPSLPPASVCHLCSQDPPLFSRRVERQLQLPPPPLPQPLGLRSQEGKNLPHLQLGPLGIWLHLSCPLSLLPPSGHFPSPPSLCLAHGDHSWHQAAQGVRRSAARGSPTPTLDAAWALGAHPAAFAGGVPHPLPYPGDRFLARGPPSCPGAQEASQIWLAAGRNFSLTAQHGLGRERGGEKGKEREEGGASTAFLPPKGSSRLLSWKSWEDQERACEGLDLKTALGGRGDGSREGSA